MSSYSLIAFEEYRKAYDIPRWDFYSIVHEKQWESVCCGANRAGKTWATNSDRKPLDWIWDENDL